MNVRSAVLLFLSMLLMGGGMFTRSQYSKNFHQHLMEIIQENIGNEFLVIEKEAKALQEDHLLPSSDQWDMVNHFFIHADSSHIITWNRNYFLPGIAFFQSSSVGGSTFIQTPRGDFLVMKWPADEGTFLYCILTLSDRFPIVNNFLPPQSNASIFPLSDIQLADAQKVEGDPLIVKNERLFTVLPGKPVLHESIFSFILTMSGVIFFLVGLWYLIKSLQSRFNYDIAFLVLFIGLLSLRLEMISLSLPSLFLQSDLFDPKKFASSSLNASMGDLFLNSLCLLFVIIYLFRNFKKFRFTIWILHRSGPARWIGGMLCLLACFFALLLPYNFVESIYHNSPISLDTQSPSFDATRIIALASVLVGCVSSFLFIHVFFLIANHLFKQSNIKFFIGCLTAAAIFFIQFYWLGQHLWPTFMLGIVFFTILKVSRLNDREFRFSFQLFIYLIFSLFIFSVQNAWAVRIFFEERQTRDQFRFGKDFLTERDVLGEYLMDQARQHIDSDPFIQVRIASPFLSKTAIAEKIKRVYLNNYFDRYEITIRTIRPENAKDELSLTYDSLGNALMNFLPTGYQGIFYTSTHKGNGVKSYHISVPINYQRAVGFVILDFVLKKVIPNNVYPELLIDNRFKQLLRNRDFSYAIIASRKLMSSFGSFNYERDFQFNSLRDPILFNKGLTGQGFFHIGIKDSNGSIALVSATVYSWFYAIANFALWFVIGLIFLFTGQGILGVISFFKGEHIDYAARIQLFIFLAFLLPVLAVSITTLTLIGRSNEEKIKNDFLERSGAISQNMATLFSGETSPGDQETDLGRWIEENTVSSKIDISVYSPEGRLIATSQPALFENQLISSLMDREAWKKIVLQREVRTVTNEHIGRLQYSCAYAAILSPETGSLEAIVGLPFFESATFLQKSQSLILSNILIVFVVVFIMFSLLSFFASSSLTFPIRLIAKTLGQTTLSGQNKQLQWNSKDEIGTLVKEYNHMVDNLEASKQALAQTEKESAWREMAKQVAHEIKNPLTPMKLTLQQMQQALKSGDLSVEKSQKSVNVLLKQVEILNEIAGSFSSFASMPSQSPAKVNLHSLLQDVVNLYTAETRGKVTFSEAGGPWAVSVDATAFSRAISNIIINALQAKRGGSSLEVNVSLSTQPDIVIIAIRDNGKGMDDEVQSKVFQPQFTTKQSGSGLGLAMAKQIIIQAGGKIWFESTVNQGTVFFIELPLVN